MSEYFWRALPEKCDKRVSKNASVGQSAGGVRPVLDLVPTTQCAMNSRGLPVAATGKELMMQIADTPLHTHPLVLGTNTFGFTSDQPAAHAVLDAFVEGGGNMIDTADEYSVFVPGNRGGEAELMIGNWLADRRNRSDVIVTTKVSQHPEFRGLSARNVNAAAEASLMRLGTDYLDIYYAHFDDQDTPLLETVAAFDNLVRSGKVRHIGISNYSGRRIREWFDIAHENGFATPVVVQPHYNLLHRAAYESDIASAVEETGMGVVPYFGLASGVLTGKYRSALDLVNARRAPIIEVFDFLNPDALRVIELVREIGRQHSTSAAAVALAWLRSRTGVVAPIASARSVDQLHELMAGAQFTLPAADIARLDAASA